MGLIVKDLHAGLFARTEHLEAPAPMPDSPDGGDDAAKVDDPQKSLDLNDPNKVTDKDAPDVSDVSAPDTDARLKDQRDKDQIDVAPPQTAVARTPLAHTHHIGRYDTAEITFKGGRLEMHESWQKTALAEAMAGGTLDLNRVTAGTLKALTPSQRRLFMRILASMELKVERRNSGGKLLTGAGRVGKHMGRLAIEMLGKVVGKTTKENAAAAMARKVWSSGDSDAFAKIFAAAPDRVMPLIQGDAARVLTVEMMGTVIAEMQESDTHAGRPGLDSVELDGIGNLFARYLEINADKDPASLSAATQRLMDISDEWQLKTTPQTAGVLTGAVIAGLYKHLGKIFGDQKKSGAYINGFTANVWAASSFVPVLGGFIAVGVVAMDTALQHMKPARDSRELANRCQGELELQMLQNPPDGWSRQDVSDCLKWVDATVLANGM